MRQAAVIVCSFFVSVPVFGQNPGRADATTSSTGVSAPLSTRQVRPRVDPANAYERVFAIVPMVGAGTMDDPKRPLYAPAPHSQSPAAHAGILGYHFEISDDGMRALVEFVAKDRSAFKALLADSTVTPFVRGQQDLARIVAAFLALKKDFNINTFRLAAM